MKANRLSRRSLPLALGLVGVIFFFGFVPSDGPPPATHVWEIAESAESLDAGSHLTRHRLVFFVRLYNETLQTFYILSLSRWKTPGFEQEGWIEIGGNLWVAEGLGEEARHNQDDELWRVPREDLLAMIQAVLRQTNDLDGWMAEGELKPGGVDDPDLIDAYSEVVPAGYLSVDIYYDFWASDSLESGYAGFCGFPGFDSPCREEGESTVTSAVGRLVCDLSDPRCEAVAWATITLPASLQGMKWNKEIYGPALPCPEEMLAEIGWRCDLTRIPEEPTPDEPLPTQPAPSA